ncbi:MAG TPA: hypothetical protein VJ905_08940 [Halalkalibaculum sp.]|nr:hypothetical protein [Halalkalibaculum sp.]
MPFSPEKLPDDPQELEQWIREQESSEPSIKDQARAKILWADTTQKSKTAYAIVYLHGFKASHGEGKPVHRQVAESLGLNLYLCRLKGHGLNVSEPLKNLSADDLMESALKALAIGRKIGEKIIIMGTSTGASLGLYLASKAELKDVISGLVLYSPLVEFYGSSQWFLGHSIPRALMKIIPGRNYPIKAEPASSPEENKIWYPSYALQGALALGEFIQNAMTEETFSRVECPTFTGYYYKSEKRQDKVVSVEAIKRMHRSLGVHNSIKILKNYPDSGTHVICSGLVSGSINRLKKDTCRFIKDKIISDSH